MGVETMLLPQLDVENHAVETEPTGKFPSSVDINPTAACNLACDFCWGPDHEIPDSVSAEQWMDIMDFFQENGTTGIVFTGGEPLIRKDIGNLLGHAKDLGLRTTLSTNALLLRRKADEVLPYVDELGLPLDGSTPENDQRMRIGSPLHFERLLGALDLVSANYPDIQVTVRTVASKVNQDDIVGIGKLLRERKGTFDRWKVYQFSPSGYGKDAQQRHQMSEEEFEAVASDVTDHFKDFNVRIYRAEERPGRYVFVGPEGNVFGVDQEGEYYTVGNLIETPRDEMTRRIAGMVDPVRNAAHAQVDTSINVFQNL